MNHYVDCTSCGERQELVAFASLETDLLDFDRRHQAEGCYLSTERPVRVQFGAGTKEVGTILGLPVFGVVHSVLASRWFCRKEQ